MRMKRSTKSTKTTRPSSLGPPIATSSAKISPIPKTRFLWRLAAVCLRNRQPRAKKGSKVRQSANPISDCSIFRVHQATAQQRHTTWQQSQKIFRLFAECTTLGRCQKARQKRRSWFLQSPGQPTIPATKLLHNMRK